MTQDRGRPRGREHPPAADPDDHRRHRGRALSRSRWSPAPGAVARNSIGIVLVGGMTIGTLFTLFVVPSVYVLLAKDHRSERAKEPDRETETNGTSETDSFADLAEHATAHPRA